MICPLCSSSEALAFHQDRKRAYFQCPVCMLVFIDPRFLPTADQEKQRYQLHQNKDSDPGYIHFLSTMLKPLKLRIGKQSKGLDFGSGPTPVLATLLKKEGYCIELYDPFFADHKEVLQERYDYLVCVETAEHFHRPHDEWRRIRQLVKAGGWIGLKTALFSESIDFSFWHYKSDPTHVCYYSKKTLIWIGTRYGLRPEFEEDDVVFFKVL